MDMEAIPAYLQAPAHGTDKVGGAPALRERFSKVTPFVCLRRLTPSRA